jgi:hypothetical protein
MKRTPLFILISFGICFFTSNCTFKHSGAIFNNNKASGEQVDFYSADYLTKYRKSENFGKNLYWSNHLAPIVDSIRQDKIPSGGYFVLSLNWDKEWKSGEYYCKVDLLNGKEIRYDFQPIGHKQKAGSYSGQGYNSSRGGNYTYTTSWGNSVMAYAKIETALPEKFQIHVYHKEDPVKFLRTYKIKLGKKYKFN